MKWILLFFFAGSFSLYSGTFDFVPHYTGIVRVDHRYYSLGYQEKYEQPAWTYYHYKKKYLKGTQDRVNSFREDPTISSDSARPEEYRYSGYDRGHMVPAGDMKISYRAMSESFYMSNISPQKPYFNRGIWRKLENQVRRWVKSKGDLHIFTGPIFGKKVRYLPRTKIGIPKAFYKIILKKKNKGDHEMIAFIFPNEKSKKNIRFFMVTVDQVERETGVDFFSYLSDRLENRLEAQVRSENWL